MDNFKIIKAYLHYTLYNVHQPCSQLGSVQKYLRGGGLVAGENEGVAAQKVSSCPKVGQKVYPNRV